MELSNQIADVNGEAFPKYSIEGGEDIDDDVFHALKNFATGSCRTTRKPKYHSVRVKVLNGVIG